VISTLIKDYFGGNISEFLQHTLVLGDDICYVLHQTFRRLSELEKEILIHLASAGHPQSYSDLQGKVSTLSDWPEVLEALASLRRRSLIEASSQGSEVLFTLQPVVMKYVEKFYLP